MIIATKAIVAKGTYGPRWESPDVELPQGAAEVAGIEDIAGEVRTQIGKVLMPLKYTQTTASDRRWLPEMLFYNIVVGRKELIRNRLQ
jgi:hypothetical protein